MLLLFRKHFHFRIQVQFRVRDGGICLSSFFAKAQSKQKKASADSPTPEVENAVIISETFSLQGTRPKNGRCYMEDGRWNRRFSHSYLVPLTSYLLMHHPMCIAYRAHTTKGGEIWFYNFGSGSRLFFFTK